MSSICAQDTMPELTSQHRGRTSLAAPSARQDRADADRLSTLESTEGRPTSAPHTLVSAHQHPAQNEINTDAIPWLLQWPALRRVSSAGRLSKTPGTPKQNRSRQA
eukprot:3719243-Rhodomonas_salina.2